MNDDRVSLLARIARRGENGMRSILELAAATYGSRPDGDDATIPTGFDPMAARLFESIVEGAYLVATSDGVFDAEERAAFERVVTAACGGSVAASEITSLVQDLADQLAEDGVERRLAKVGEPLRTVDQGWEVLRIAALLAEANGEVSDVERDILGRLAVASRLTAGDVDRALADARAAIGR